MPDSFSAKTFPHWVEEAKKLPIAFSQVREDALLDLDLLQQVRTPAKVLMVASGGCTAALLLTTPHLQELVLVDPNPSQMALSRLKIRLLKEPKDERLKILGHLPMPVELRKKNIETYLETLQLPKNSLGPIDLVAQDGPDYVGRYERVFAQLQRELRPIQPELVSLLSLQNTAQQKEKLSLSLKNALESAFQKVMDLPYLIHLFSAEATQNSILPFSQHFFLRTLHVLETLPALENPYLQQVLYGRFLKKGYPWLECPPILNLPSVYYENLDMFSVLQNAKEQKKTFHLIHLSNILDWLREEEAQKILALAFEVLNTNGFLILRQLNSSLEIRQLGPFFQWQEPLSTSWHQNDRSYFYRKIHIGKKT